MPFGPRKRVEKRRHPTRLLTNRHTLGLGWGRDGLFILAIHSILDLALLVVDAHAALQDAAFLDGRARHVALVALRRLQVQRVAVGVCGRLCVWRRGQVWDRVWRGMFDADAGDADVACFAGFAEGVVAAIEVFALLALVLRVWLVTGSRNEGQVQR